MSRTLDLSTSEYRALCEKYSVPLFHQPWWLDVLCRDWTGVAVQAGGLDNSIGIWPVPLERKLGVRMSRSPMLTPYLGPFIFRESGAVPDEGTCSAIVGELTHALPAVRVWQTSTRPWTTDETPFDRAGFHTSRRPTYLLQLKGSTTEELLARFHSEIRRRLKRASEAQVTISAEPESAAEMYRLQQATLVRKGKRLYYPVEKFEDLVRLATERGSGALWIARRNGRIVGAQWSLWDASSCYNIGLARVDDEGGKTAPEALLWHAIRHAHALGLETFDFEGSSVPTIAQFFARFGATMHHYLSLKKNSSPVWRLVRAIRP